MNIEHFVFEKIRYEWQSIMSYLYIFHCFWSFPVSNVSRSSRKGFSWSTILRLDRHKNHQKETKESLRHIEMAISPDCRLVSGDFRGLLFKYLLLLNHTVGSGTCVGGEKNVTTKKILIMKKRGFAGLCLLFSSSRCRWWIYSSSEKKGNWIDAVCTRCSVVKRRCAEFHLYSMWIHLVPEEGVNNH